MAKKVQFAKEHFYHVYNRGVEKREIFLDDADRYRFIHGLYEFNDKMPARTVSSYHLRKKLQTIGDMSNNQNKHNEIFGIRNSKSTRKPLVGIVAFVLMPNHFHILLQQKRKDGVSEFLRKIGTGYTNYFNQKYKRSGHLFQGKFKAAEVLKDEYFLYLTSYIHLNPVPLIFPKWQKRPALSLKKKEREGIIAFLESYRWSSLLDYLGKKNFPSILDKKIIFKMIPSQDYRDIVFDALTKDFPLAKETILDRD